MRFCLSVRELTPFATKPYQWPMSLHSLPFADGYTPNGAAITPAFADDPRDIKAEEAIRATVPKGEVILHASIRLRVGTAALAVCRPSSYER